MTEITIRDKKKGRIEFYSRKHKTLGKQHYWRVIGTNGLKLGRSSEGYNTARGCRKGFEAHVAVCLYYGLGGSQ